MTRFLLAALAICSPLIVFSQIDLSIGPWEPTSHPSEVVVNSLASYGEVLFTGSYGGGLHTSNDGGVTWERSYDRFPAPFVTDLLVLGDEILASTYQRGVYSSLDGGESWRTVNEGLQLTSGNCLATDGENIFLGTDSGVYKKKPSDDSWTYLPFPPAGGRGTYVGSLTVSGELVIAGGTSVVYVSRNGGAEWVAIQEGFSVDVTSGIILPSAIYISTSGQGVFSVDTVRDEVSLVEEGPLSSYIGVTIFKMIANDDGVINLTSNRGIVEGDITFNDGLPTLSVLDLIEYRGAYFVATASDGVYRIGMVVNQMVDPGQNDEIPGDKIAVFPNPSSGAITMKLDLPEQTEVEVTLLSAQGEIVRQLLEGRSSTEGNWQRSINLGGSPPGLYVLRFKTRRAQGSKLLMIR